MRKLQEYVSSAEDTLALAVCKRTLLWDSNVKLLADELSPQKLLLKFLCSWFKVLLSSGKYSCPRRATRNFQGRGGFVKLGHFDKHFIKKSRKKAPQGKILEFFLLDTLKTTF